MTNPFRSLPAVDAVLRHASVESLCHELPRSQVVRCIRSVLDKIRSEVRDQGNEAPSEDVVVQRTIAAARSLLRERLDHVINATGIVLHTNLGRAVLAESAAQRVTQAARYTSVELSLKSGRRARRGAHAEQLLTTLTGAPAALVVNNCAAATLLALQGLAVGRNVIISRGQLVEIGGGFRLPEVFEAAGVALREVGTTNRTRLDDYEDAINEGTAALLRVHRSNFRQSGFVSEPDVDELVPLAREHEVLMIDDLGSGCLTPLTPLGLEEPDVNRSLRSGADLVLFSGDKLLGGPQAGILLGSEEVIDRLRRHPLARVVRVCKLTLAALEATLELHLAGDAQRTVPTLAMMHRPVEQVKADCRAVVVASGLSSRVAEVVDCQSEVGGGTLADQKLPSAAIRLHSSNPIQLLADLRHPLSGSEEAVPVLGRIDDGAVLLDLRTVQQDEQSQLAARLRHLCGDGSGAGH